MLEFILFDGNRGQHFYPFRAGSWEAAEAIAKLKGWEVVDIHVDAVMGNVISVGAPALV